MSAQNLPELYDVMSASNLPLETAQALIRGLRLQANVRELSDAMVAAEERACAARQAWEQAIRAVDDDTAALQALQELGNAAAEAPRDALVWGCVYGRAPEAITVAYHNEDGETVVETVTE